jgi:hypothetical protein
MYKTLFLIINILVFFLILPGNVEAIVDPRQSPNNRFGIHITDLSDVELAADLVNHNGGDWGYVTFVIRQDDRDQTKWQYFFDQLREKRLIPLVRIATSMTNTHWLKPSIESVDSWVDFLQSLNWVTQNRYVILFNEPNHAKEWGGEINPEEYAEIYSAFHHKLKVASPDYFILPAAMDDAASDTRLTIRSFTYLRRMHEARPEIFTLFDGWNSHAYPNPAFSGKVSDRGSGTITGFEKELEFVGQFGVPADIPIFITETGWQHREGRRKNNRYLTPDRVADNFEYAFSHVWNRENIVAVTPFILNYPEPPFDYFTWLKPSTGEPLPHFEKVRNLPKVKGDPAQIHQSTFVDKFLPEKLLADARYSTVIRFKNTGQTIWNPETTTLSVASTLPPGTITIHPVPETRPGEEAQIIINFDTSGYLGPLETIVQLKEKEASGQVAVHEAVVKPKNDFITQLKLWVYKIQHPALFEYVLNP